MKFQSNAVPAGTRTRSGFTAVALVLATATLMIHPPSATAQTPIPWADAQFSGYATGTVAHTSALQDGDLRLVNTDVAFSGAAVDSGNLGTRLLNEMQREVQPELPDKNSYARGSGLETGMAQPPDGDPQVTVAGKAEADAPPSTGPVTEELGPVPADPAAWASLVRGQATARWHEDLCILGTDISRGLGFAANVQLLDAGGDDADEGLDEPVLSLAASDPARAVSQSVSRTLLVPQANGTGFGLASETRQTIAPVTFFEGQATQFTIEFLGEWVLRAVATGLPGGAVVHYGPGEVSPETPILRIIDPDGDIQQIVFQDLFGDEGLVIPLGPVGEIVIGENPRAIGGNHETDPTQSPDGTVASGAVDVVRVQLFRMEDDLGNVTQQAADVRIGHMEVQARVPVGGILCEIPVQKSANPPAVQVGQSFVTPITIINPFDCDLTQVRVTDTITTVQGARFRVTSTEPVADQVPSGEVSSGTVVWNDVGPIPAHESRTITVTIEALATGRIDDIANVTAVLDNCPGEDAEVAGVAIALAGAAVAGVSPLVQVPVGEVLGVAIPRTGPAAASAVLGGLSLLGLAGAGALLRRRWRA